jgi:hypothetical protein
MERYGAGRRFEGFGEGAGTEQYGFWYGFPYGSAYEGEELGRWSGGISPFGGDISATGYGRYGELRSTARKQERVHTWRGGVLGWLGSGMRAAAAWTGIRMQWWGSFLGGKLSGGAEQIGESVRGGGERVGQALEESGTAGTRSYRRAGAGRPPRTYRRPDERILDEVYERIAHSAADADEVEVEVSDGVVTLSGSVPSRIDKRLIEGLTEAVFGVLEVHNHLKLARRIEGKGTPEAVAPEAKAGAEAERHNGQGRAGPESPTPQA